MTRIAILSAIVFFTATIPGAAFAEEATSTPGLQTVTIHLSVAAPSATLYDADIKVTECPIVDGSATTTLNAKCALDQSGLAVFWSPFGDDYFLDSVDGNANDFENGAFWNWWEDLEYGQTALNKHELAEGEHLLVALGVFPLKIEPDTAEPAEGSDVSITAYAFGFDGAFNPVWNVSDGATIYANGATTTTSSNGIALLTASSLDPIDVYAEKEGYVQSDTLTLTPRPARANVTVRNGSDIAFAGAVDLAPPSAPDVLLSPTNSTSTFPVPARSALATLAAIDTTEESFSVTNLQYFDSFGAFFVNCITITEEACGMWQYTVNGAYPAVGMDAYALSDGDTAYIYFGSPRRVTLATSTIEAGTEFTALAEAYDPAADTYGPAEGFTLGVTRENPDDPFSPIVVATSTAGADGTTLFTLSLPGTYAVGIAEDFFFPSSALMVTEASSTETGAEEPADESQNETPASGGGGGGGSAHTVFNSSLALSFLAGKQQADGSFANILLSDWAALAFAAHSAEAEAKERLVAYLKTSAPQTSSVTDYERHAMALMALNINPYDGAGSDYITPIVTAFDGTQFGDPSLVNDDIFALIPLLKAGYGANDAMIDAGVAFVVSKQKESGSWEGSVDVTAAAVQALAPLSSLPNVGDTLAKAKQYLHSTQKFDGGWGNSFSTSWAAQAIHAFGEAPNAWQPGGIYPSEYLALNQWSDGGMGLATDDENTRVWASAYAIPAAESKTWHMLLNAFPKPAAETAAAQAGGSGSVLGASTSTTSTTDETSDGTPEETATTTPDAVAPEPEPESVVEEKKQNSKPTEPIRVTEVPETPGSSDDIPVSPDVPEQRASAATANISWLSQFFALMLHVADQAVRFLAGFLP